MGSGHLSPSLSLLFFFQQSRDQVPGLRNGRVDSSAGPELHSPDIFLSPALFWPGWGLSRHPLSFLLLLCLWSILPALTTSHRFQRGGNALAVNKGFPRRWEISVGLRGCVFKGWAAEWSGWTSASSTADVAGVQGAGVSCGSGFLWFRSREAPDHEWGSKGAMGSSPQMGPTRLLLNPVQRKAGQTSSKGGRSGPDNLFAFQIGPPT